MDTVKGLLRAVSAGAITAEKAAPAIARLIRGEAVADAAETAGMSWVEVTSGRMAGSVADRANVNTFTKVEAAHLQGAITDEQYAVIRAAVVGGQR